jgi:hypothetical protein
VCRFGYGQLLLCAVYDSTRGREHDLPHLGGHAGVQHAQQADHVDLRISDRIDNRSRHRLLRGEVQDHFGLHLMHEVAESVRPDVEAVELHTSRAPGFFQIRKLPACKIVDDVDVVTV